MHKAQGVVVLGLRSQSGHWKENVRGIANENHGGKHTKTLLPEMPWVHSAFVLFLQFSRDKMDDHVEEGSVEEEEEEDEGSNSSFFVRGGNFL